MFGFIAALVVGAIILGSASPSNGIRFALSNQGPDGPVDFWQVWIDDGSNEPLKWAGTDQWPTPDEARAAAHAWISSVGGTPVEA